MNKSDDERILAPGEYIDALNLRTGSTAVSEVGSLEKAKGNEKLTDITFQGTALSSEAVCIGSYADQISNNIYWFINDPNNGDLIVSYNVVTGNIIYHVLSVSVLNFNKTYHINGVNLIGDLLFWTDDYNPPRKINVKRTYGLPTGGSDTIVEDDLSVIVKPPSEKPTVILTESPPLEEGYVFDNFLCFAYRYRYLDGEYSALSQFTSPAFRPQDEFDFDFSTSLNDSMQNKFNSLTLQFNTGDKRVTDIELCFKDSNNDVIKVIDSYNKAENGWVNNATQSILFKDKKIKNVLATSEILRLFDNVPRFAKAQTFQSNRLMYGNYVDGYNIKDSNGNDININFNSELFQPSQESPLTNTSTSSNIVGTITDSDYLMGNPGVTNTISDTEATFDFTGVQFTAGTLITFSCSIVSGLQSEVVNDNAALLNLNVTRSNPVIANVGFSFYINDSYANAYDFFNSDEFERAFGIGPANIAPTKSFTSFTSAGSGSPPTVTDIINNGSLLNPAGNTVTGTTANPVNSAANFASPNNPTGCQDGTSISPPNYPVGQTGFKITTVAPPNNDTNKITMQLPMPVYYSTPGSAGGVFSFEGVRYQASAPPFFTVNGLSDKKSLHSNRDYDIGLIYMDEYNRSSTPLLSNNSSFKVPASNSVIQNKAKTTIPPSMNPPSWAKKYKFAIKPSGLDYDTIYAVRAYPDADEVDFFWCLLEGEQAAKVTEGQILIAKNDGNSPKSNYEEVVVITKTTQPNINSSTYNFPAGVYIKLKRTTSYDPIGGDFKSVNVEEVKSEQGSSLAPQYANLCLDLSPMLTGPWTTGIIPVGTYITIDVLFEREKADTFLFTACKEIGYQHLKITKRANKDYNVSTGPPGNNFRSNLTQMIVDQFVPGFNGDFPVSNIFFGPNSEPEFPIKFTGEIIQTPSANKPLGDYHVITLNPSNTPGNPAIGFACNYQACTSAVSPTELDFAPSKISASITISEQISQPLVFETEPVESNPNFFFEGEESYEITNGKHQGNFQNQFDWDFHDNAQNNAYRTLASLPPSPNGYGGNVAFSDSTVVGGNNTPHSYSVGDTVIINQSVGFTHTEYQGEHTVVEIPDQYTIVIDVAFQGSTSQQGGSANSPAIIINEFYDCFTFRNGVESIRILDSIKKQNFTIGNRVYGVSDEEFKEADRGASVTYSGLFNLEGNINRLNSFNLGNLNFKDLDNRYGDIQILDGRKSDLLALQENKISYVLAEKTQLLNSDGSANISASTNVLGTQIARVEEYGISRNPESYVQYGVGKYFTDSARGAVIELRGDSYSNEQLSVVSNFGLRSWFRDLFIEYPNTQKIGSYDPFIDEYVLSSNEIKLPQEIKLYNCGNILTFTTRKDNVNYIVDYGTGVGSGSLGYDISAGEITLNVTYDGTTATTGAVTGSGTLNFTKDKASVEEANVEVVVSNPSVTPATFQLTNTCINAAEFSVVLVTVYNPADAGKQITNKFRWSNSEPFASPLYSDTIIFETDIIPGKTAGNYVAQYEIISGQEGVNMIPTTGLVTGSVSSVVDVITSKEVSDTYDFDPTSNRQMYFWSNILYQNEPTNINALLTAANNISGTSEITNGVYSGSFNFNPSAPPPALNYLYIIYDYFT